MSIPEELSEILDDLHTARFDPAGNAALSNYAIVAMRNLRETLSDDQFMHEAGHLAALMFYAGREHASRGYTDPVLRDPDSDGPAELDIPDDVESLLNPQLRSYHVEFHEDVRARNPEEAIAACNGDDWRVTERTP